MTRRHGDNRGSGLLELILFVPLGMLFLFAAVDCGIAWFDRASISNALREGLHAQLLRTRHNSVMTYDESYRPEIDEARLKDVLESSAEWIFAGIADTRGIEEERLIEAASVEVAAVRLDIDEETGEVTGFSVMSGAASPSVRGAFAILSASPSYRYTPRDRFIEQALETSGMSRFALRRPGGGFYPIAVVIYGEVTSFARGLNPAPVHALLSNFFTIQEQALFPLRGGFS